MAVRILGLSAFYHDSAACLLVDGEVVAAAQEERFTRKKHDAAFPTHATRYCLQAAGLKVTDLDHVVFYDKPFLKFERLLETHLAFAPKGLRSFLQAVPLWIGEKLWLPQVIQKELDADVPLLFAEHHESHAASAFFPSPFESAAVLTLDGVGEWATASYGVGRDNRVTLWKEMRFPHSPGLLYSALTYFCGFKVNSGEYKLMGLAPYGEPRYVDKLLEEVVDLRDDGSFALNPDYFDYCAGLRMTSARMDRLFGGPPREPESPITQREMDLARSIQEVTEEIVLRMARHIRKETGEKHLCLAGGVALNCVANGRLLRAGIFEDLYIQPAAGDAGGALGAALAGYHHFLDRPRAKPGSGDWQRGSFLGPSYSDESIQTFLQSVGAVATLYDSAETLTQFTAKWLAQGKVVGWFQGRMEFGPRALGSRSILADPRDPGMQKRLNLMIKMREGFRPFAPAVLAEKAGEWFDLDRPSPYMLLVAPVLECRRINESGSPKVEGLARLSLPRSQVPAVTHVDGSARVQTVHSETQPLLHGLITAFDALTGCPMLVNTSFNLRGEPVVESPEQAYACFMRSDMDVLVMGRHLLLKADQPKWQDANDWRAEFPPD